jgi:hypothetical protein
MNYRVPVVTRRLCVFFFFIRPVLPQRPLLHRREPRYPPPSLPENFFFFREGARSGTRSLRTRAHVVRLSGQKFGRPSPSWTDTCKFTPCACTMTSARKKPFAKPFRIEPCWHGYLCQRHRCTYAHRFAEIRPKLVKSNHKTSMCWNSDNGCPYHELGRCNYLRKQFFGRVRVWW